MFLRIFKKLILPFQISIFSLLFSLCFFCVSLFDSLCFLSSSHVSSVSITFYSHIYDYLITKRERTYINKASNINNIINYNYDIMAKSRYEAIFNKCTKNEVFLQRILQKMWPNPQFPANLATFTKEILNRKLYSLCSEFSVKYYLIWSCLGATLCSFNMQNSFCFT